MFSTPADKKNDLGFCLASVFLIRAPINATDKFGGTLKTQFSSLRTLLHSVTKIVYIDLGGKPIHKVSV